MALSAPVKAVALVVFLAAIAGATYGVSSFVGDTVESQLYSVTPTRALSNATPGNEVSYVVTVSNRGTASTDVVVEVAGAATGRSAVTTIRGNSTVGVFVTVSVPEGLAPGEHALDVRLLEGERVIRTRAGLLTLRVMPEAPGLEPGDSAEVIYVGRLTATGRVFNTNDPVLLEVPFPKTDTYRFSQGLLPFQTAPRPNVVSGLYEGMLGMQPGEHRSVSFGPEKGYGNATDEQPEPREERLQREITLVNDAQRVARATFDEYILETRQGQPSDFEAGDTFILNQQGNDWPYQIVSITPQVVEYRLAAVVGESYTVYPFWPNASVVTSINETQVSFRTTPTTQPGQAFTMRAYWPQMSTVREVTEDEIIVRHSPPVGYSYTSITQLGQPREATIKEVSEERIVVAYPSPNPLAGRDLTFDVILVSLTKGASR